MIKSFHYARAISPLFLVGSFALTACSGAPGAQSDGPTSATSESQTASHPARLLLTGAVLSRLQQRAAAGDAAWTALKSHCDQLTTGTVNLPSGNAYPNFPNVGQGYQGDGYLPEVMSLGLCYQTALATDAASAAKYASAGDAILRAMSTAPSAGGQSPSTDSGYGMRNYGVGMAFGFDWLYDGLQSSTRTQVISALNSWIDWYDASGFSRSAPVGNYFAGYILAKASAAIATEGDDPKASTYWSSVESTMFPSLVQGIYAPSMQGGGWPEGWEYGPLAIENVSLFLWSVKTGKGLDWFSQIPVAHDEAAYMSHFTWPSRKHIDDQGTIHSGVELTPPAKTAAAMAAMLAYNGDSYAPIARGFASTMIATNGSDAIAPWQSFLYLDPAQPQADYTTQGLSYFAAGPNHVAVRSSWQTDAVWGSFVPGTYIDSTDSGEQSYNAGAVSIVQGDTPIIVNATGRLPLVGGTSGEDLVYADSYGSPGLRQLFNTFGASGAKQAAMGPSDAKTHATNYEDNGVFVHARGVQLEQMYQPSGVVGQWTRDFAYVRPGVFVVLDRSTTTASDSWISWHTGAAPSAGSVSDSTQSRFDVPGGSVRVLLPKSAPVKTVPVASGVTRLEVHATNPSENFLSVISVGQTPDQVRVSNADGNVSAGSLVGVHVLSARNAVVLFNGDHAAAQTTTNATYTVKQTAAADHVIFDVAPSSNGYSITATPAQNGGLTIAVQQGGIFQPSAVGTLAFVVGTDGSVQPAPASSTVVGSGNTTAVTTPTAAPAPTTTGTTTTTAAPAPSAPAPATGLANGSFESWSGGTPTGWARQGGATVSSSATAQDGSASAQIATSTWGDGIRQTVTLASPLAAGTAITASAYAASVSGSASPLLQLVVNYADGTAADYVNKGFPTGSAGAWSQVQQSFTPSHPVSSVEVHVINNSGTASTFLVDAVTLSTGGTATTTTTTATTAAAPSSSNVLADPTFSSFAGTAPAGWTKAGLGSLAASSSAGSVTVNAATWGDGLYQVVPFSTPLAAGASITASATAQRVAGDAGLPILQLVVSYADGTPDGYFNTVFADWSQGPSIAKAQIKADHPVRQIAYRIVSNAGMSQSFVVSQPSLTAG